jgi:hypothetical protein
VEACFDLAWVWSDCTGRRPSYDAVVCAGVSTSVVGRMSFLYYRVIAQELARVYYRTDVLPVIWVIVQS